MGNVLESSGGIIILSTHTQARKQCISTLTTQYKVDDVDVDEDVLECGGVSVVDVPLGPPARIGDKEDAQQFVCNV